jgi:hypothetical protein
MGKVEGNKVQSDGVTRSVEVADTPLQRVQDMHGSFSRADTRYAMMAPITPYSWL